MKTGDWIDMLARNAGPAPRAIVGRRLAPAALLGLLASAALALAVIGPIPAALYATPVPWMKFAYAGLLAAAAGWWTARLSRPAAPLSRPAAAAAIVLAAMAAVGLVEFASAGDRRVDMLLGESWLECPWNVLGLSLPALAATLWAVRGLAPVRLRLAGFAAGVLAGGVGALGYSLACPESSAAFVAAWYSLGIVLTGVLGAFLGPRVLRW